MFTRFILPIAIFFCIAFQSISAHTTTNNHLGGKELQKTQFSVDTERLFFESGKLFFESEYSGDLPLTSLNYLNGRCYTNLSPDLLANSYMQGYRCNKCSYILIKTSPGSPGSCPSCGSYDWTLM